VFVNGIRDGKLGRVVANLEIKNTKSAEEYKNIKLCMLKAKKVQGTF
jgi:hypothetical protein